MAGNVNLGKNDLWPEDPRTGNIIPLRRTAEGRLEFSWPNALRATVNDVRELVTAPGKALHGDYTPSEIDATGVRTALTMAGLGLGMPAPEGNALHMFGGIKAKTANMPALSQALTLEGRAASPQEIHAATGWFRGPDNKWRFEIPDNEAMLHGQNVVNGKLDIGRSQVMPMDEVLHHPELYAAYPQIKNTRVSGATTGPGTGAFFPSRNEINIAPDTRKNALSTTLHEVQHKVQDLEGFAEGGSPSEFISPSHLNNLARAEHLYDTIAPKAQSWGVDPERVMTGINMYSNGLPMGDTYPHLKKLLNADPDLLDQFKEVHNAKAAFVQVQKDAHEKYRNLAGEAESFLVQDRHATGDHSSFPPSTPGYPPYEKQTVILNGEEQPRLVVPVDHDPFALTPGLTPVDHDPWQHTAEPVDHDPFATETNQGAAK